MKLNRCGKAAPLTPEQLQTLLDNAPSPKYRALWAVQYYTAARVGEALQLRWEAVQGDVVTFLRSTTKTKQTRQVEIHPKLREELTTYWCTWTEENQTEPTGEEFLFHGQDSTTQPMTRQAADKVLRATTGLLGMDGVSTHSFRRTAAQKAIQAGLSPYQVMALTGHTSVASFSEYIDVSAADRQAAVSAL